MRLKLDFNRLMWWPLFETILLLKLMLNTETALADIDSAIQCFSCMSKDLDEAFQKGLSDTYLPQKKFDDRCNDPFSSKGIPLINCSTTCAILKEADIKMGMLVGHVYIRGCLNKILVKGFNHSALETHRFLFDDTCKILPWNLLMSPKGKRLPGEVKMCTCYGNRCNGSPRTTTDAEAFINVITLSLASLIIMYYSVFR